MKRFQLLLLTFFLSWAVIGTAGSINSEANDFAISDFDTVPEAVESIKATLEDQGLEVVGVIDHAANAENVDLELPATQLILFRDRRLEKRLLRTSPMLAIDLPQKILVWEDPASGEIKLLYNTDGYLSDRHGIKTRNLLHRLNQTLKQFGRLDNGLITIDSQFSVEDTIENLKMVLQDNDFFIPFTYDFTGKSNKEKPSQLIIFGNPKVGTPLMQNQQAMGLDLPQKFLVWEDHKNKVHVTYNNPKFFGKRHGLQGLDTVLGNIANRLEALANEGAGNELVDQSNLLQSTSNLPIAQADINFPVMVVIGKPTAINPTTYQAVDNALRGPTRIPGTHTNSQSNSGTNTINIVKPSVKMSPEEILKNATDRAQDNADRAAEKAREKAKKAQTKADEAKQESKQLKLEAEQEKQELDQMGGAASRSQRRRVERAQRRANSALQKANDLQLKANQLAQQSTDLTTRAPKGIDRNIIQRIGQAVKNSAESFSENLSKILKVGYDLIRDPATKMEFREYLESVLSGEKLQESLARYDKFLDIDKLNDPEITRQMIDEFAGFAVTKVVKIIGLAKNVDNLLKPGGQLLGKAGRSSKIREISGGFDEAQNFFDQLTKGGEVIKNSNFPGTLVKLPSGGTVGLRSKMTKSPNTAATIDVNIPNIPIKKIKFNP